jgi:methyl-accepting chemotaxis protein
MQRLVNNVAAIDERVSVIEQVARRTDLLALNTTIRASADSRSASTSDAAANIGQLSGEVAQLVDILGQATRDIAALSGAITSDARDTVQSMEQTLAELGACVGQTQKAGDALQAIRLDSDNLRLRVAAMADKTVAQSGVVSRLSENMDVINGITQQTSDAVAANAESLNELQELASELRQRLSDFRLPSRLISKQAPQENTATDSKPSQARKAADRAVFHE